MSRLTIRIVLFLQLLSSVALSQKTGISDSLLQAIDKQAETLMRAGEIPGMSLTMIYNGVATIRTFGYADKDRQVPVNSSTLFELGSCSKAFTALGLARLLQAQQVRQDYPVARYIPWLHFQYKGKPAEITIGQLMHHTGGIPWSTISKIPATNADDALERTVTQLKGLELKNPPGKKYEYATIDYDILALVIQNVTKMPFESYIQSNVIDRLHLTRTTIGTPADAGSMAAGYKIGFFRARKYSPPPFRGNNAAGYVISSANDMAKWLSFQVGAESDPSLYAAAQLTHQRDETVPLHGMDSYAMGWQVSLSGDGEIYHDGLNPNFSSYVVFRKRDSTGVAVLSNSNSSYTNVIGNTVMKMLEKEKIEKEYDPGDGNDRAFSIASILLGIYCLSALAYLFFIITGILTGKRQYAGYSQQKGLRIASLFLVLIPFGAGVYLLPEAVYHFSWAAMITWTPESLYTTLLLLCGSVAFTCLIYIFSQGFPEKDKFKRVIPQLLLLSLLSGFANMLLVVLITSSLDTNVGMGYLVFYYILALFAYLSGRRFVQATLVRFTMDVIYELRVNLTDNILSTSYRKFETIDKGFVYTALNDDVSTIGESANMFVVLATSLFTAAGALLYMASIAFWAALLTFMLILILTALYYFVSNSTNKYFEQARDARNGFMRLVNGMIDGFKEISISSAKRREYREDVAVSAGEFRLRTSTATIRFVNASIIGEAVLIIIMGAVAFGFPSLFPSIKTYTLISFLIVLLYLIGPVNAILSAVPAVMRLRISIRRINEFRKSVPSVDNMKARLPGHAVPATVDTLAVSGIAFRYTDGEGAGSFSVGPVDLSVSKGEIIFIVGGNGSGKTTLARLLTGLYVPDEGAVLINGKEVPPALLGEFFAAVFNPMHLFGKLYNVDTDNREEEIAQYLRRLDLSGKVSVKKSFFSTIDLSQGQRKRLGLLQCYLEDAPIYLFDEWAADQDPIYRQYFYKTLLPEMKQSGKIVIAITHDEHYFDVADRIYKMDEGKLELYTSKRLWSTTPSFAQ